MDHAREWVTGGAEACTRTPAFTVPRAPRAGAPPPPAACRRGDEGYSYPHIRQWLRRHRIRAVIPEKLAIHHLAVLYLGIIRQLLRRLLSLSGKP